MLCVPPLPPQDDLRAVAAANIAAGGSAGMFAAALTTPLDVVKTKRQLSFRTGPGLGLVGTLAEVAREKGMRCALRALRRPSTRNPSACADLLSPLCSPYCFCRFSTPQGAFFRGGPPRAPRGAFVRDSAGVLRGGDALAQGAAAREGRPALSGLRMRRRRAGFTLVAGGGGPGVHGCGGGPANEERNETFFWSTILLKAAAGVMSSCDPLPEPSLREREASRTAADETAVR